MIRPVTYSLATILLTIGLSQTAHSETIRIRKNLIDNAGFEQVESGIPVGWNWSAGKAKATLSVNETNPHGGKRAVRIQKRHAASPHVFGHLETTVRLVPGQTYTLSCYYRSDDPGTAWFGGGHGWRLRSPFKPTGGQWRRAQLTFTAMPEERNFHIMFNSDSPTEGLWLDDIQLEEGDTATEFEADVHVEPGRPLLRIQKAKYRPNLLPNGSFEKLEKLPKGWQWHGAKADAKFEHDTAEAHTGSRSVRLSNNTPVTPHVFGQVRLVPDLKVKPNTTYTISCYVKGDKIGVGWIGGGKGWNVRCRFPRSTDGRWDRISQTFTTDDETTRIPIMIVTEGVSEPFWVDDIQLVEGEAPAPAVDPSLVDRPALYVELPRPVAVRHRGRLVRTDWNTTRFPREKFHFVRDTLWAEGWLVVPKSLDHAVLSAEVKAADGTSAAKEEKRGPLEKGVYLIAFGAHVGGVNEAIVSIRIADAGKPEETLAESTFRRQLITAEAVEDELEKAAELTRRVKDRIEKVTDEGKDTAYLTATYTMLGRFLEYAKQDLGRDEVARAYDAALEMQTAAEKALRREYLPPVPRYQTAEQGRGFQLDGPAQLGTVRYPDGRIEKDRPIQFVGVGHFGQVKRDIEQLNDFGMNIFQIEFGPSSVLPTEDKIDTRVVDDYLKILDRAAAANVSMNLLLSPHYFPRWAMEKYPHLADAGGGFLKYDVHAPEARQVIEKFLRVVIPRIKDHPALHSLCLSNEPVFCETTKSRYVREKWHAWLEKEHGTIDRLNAKWGSDYKAFGDVPLPEVKFEPTPICYDFVRFNQEAFAEWHRWMADIIHEMAPEMPVHAKIMMHAHFNQNRHGAWSVAPQLFGELSQFHGNDHCKFYSSRGEWANPWFMENAGYDYQRSMGDKPVFNSENHLIRDRNFDGVPPEHVYNVFWQGAIHGQSATTTWVWERSYSATADSAGSILHRPGCVDAMGRAGLDLMRLAPEVTAIQNLRPQIALLWSDATLVARHDYIASVQAAYEAFNFAGVRLGFVTDRQMAEYVKTKKLPPMLEDVKLIIVAGAWRVPETTLQGLEQFEENGGFVGCLGDCFQANEYGRPFSKQYKVGMSKPEPKDAKALFDELIPVPEEVGLKRPVVVTDADGNPVWGVEYLAAKEEAAKNGATKKGDRLLVNLCNYLTEPRTVEIRVDGKAVGGVDLLGGKTSAASWTLAPLESVLVEVRR